MCASSSPRANGGAVACRVLLGLIWHIAGVLEDAWMGQVYGGGLAWDTGTPKGERVASAGSKSAAFHSNFKAHVLEERNYRGWQYYQAARGAAEALGDDSAGISIDTRPRWQYEFVDDDLLSG